MRHKSSALAAALALLLLARWFLELRGGSWSWGLDYARYLGPGWRWVPWLLAVELVALAALGPVRAAVARILGPLAARPAGVLLLAALAAGALCFSLPDRTFFTGDFALRRSAVAGLTHFDRLFPQATPLDRWLHLVVPRALRSWTGLPVETIASALGAIQAALFATLAAVFARRCGARGLAAVVAAATVAGSAALGLFTGYDKTFAELSLVTLAFAVAGLGELSRGRPGWTSGLLVVAALALHRSGMALLPAWLALWALVPAPASARGPRGWAWARLLPAGLIALLLPLAWRVSRAVDARHLAPGGAAQVLADAVDPGRLLALANLALLLIPLAPLFPVALALSGSGRERSLRWLAWLAASWLLPMLVVHPVQGEFRDWDDFAPGAVAITLPLALLLARACARGRAPLAIALAAAALVPRVQWLALQSTPARSLARIESWAAGPPAPRPTIAAATLEFVAVAHFGDGRVAEGRHAMSAAVAQVPWERLYIEWANAESMAGDWALALELYDQAARLYPRDPMVWRMLTRAAFGRGDRQAAARGVAGWRRLEPGDSVALQIEGALRAVPGAPQGR